MAFVFLHYDTLLDTGLVIPVEVVRDKTEALAETIYFRKTKIVPAFVVIILLPGHLGILWILWNLG